MVLHYISPGWQTSPGMKQEMECKLARERSWSERTIWDREPEGRPGNKVSRDLVHLSSFRLPVSSFPVWSWSPRIPVQKNARRRVLYHRNSTFFSCASNRKTAAHIFKVYQSLLDFFKCSYLVSVLLHQLHLSPRRFSPFNVNKSRERKAIEKLHHTSSHNSSCYCWNYSSSVPSQYSCISFRSTLTGVLSFLRIQSRKQNVASEHP